MDWGVNKVNWGIKIQEVAKWAFFNDFWCIFTSFLRLEILSKEL